MLLLADSRLDNSGVVGIGDERDGNVDLGYFSIESFGVIDIELDWSVRWVYRVLDYGIR